MAVKRAYKEDAEDDTVNLGDGTVNLGDGTVNLGDGTVNIEDDPINLKNGSLNVEEIIYRIIVVKEGIAAPEISKLIKKSLRTTKRYLAKLKESQKIEFRGALKTGGYYVKNK